MTFARLRHVALSLQAWLIELDYDTELTGDDDAFRLNIHYHGFEYSKRQALVTLELTIHDKFTIKSATNLGTALLSLEPAGSRNALKIIVSNLKELKAEAERELIERIHQETTTKLKDSWREHGYSTRAMNRAIMYGRTPPPQPHYRPKGKIKHI